MQKKEIPMKRREEKRRGEEFAWENLPKNGGGSEGAWEWYKRTGTIRCGDDEREEMLSSRCSYQQQQRYVPHPFLKHTVLASNVAREKVSEEKKRKRRRWQMACSKMCSSHAGCTPAFLTSHKIWLLTAVGCLQHLTPFLLGIHPPHSAMHYTTSSLSPFNFLLSC